MAIRTAWPATRGVGQTAPASTWPMTTQGLSPATAQPSIAEIAERRQRGERLHVLSGHEPMRLDEAHLLSGQPVDTRMRDLTSLVPARLDVGHQPTFSQPRFGAWLPAS